MGHGPAHRLLEQIGVRIIFVASTNTEIHTDNWIDRTNFLMMMMKMKKRWLNKTAGLPIFGFPLRQGLELHWWYLWSPLVKIRSSIKSGKHRSSFSRYSKAAKVVAAILFGGESYLVTLPRY